MSRDDVLAKFNADPDSNYEYGYAYYLGCLIENWPMDGSVGHFIELADVMNHIDVDKIDTSTLSGESFTYGFIGGIYPDGYAFFDSLKIKLGID